jgi:hypothetical protein
MPSFSRIRAAYFRERTGLPGPVPGNYLLKQTYSGAAARRMCHVHSNNVPLICANQLNNVPQLCPIFFFPALCMRRPVLSSGQPAAIRAMTVRISNRTFF